MSANAPSVAAPLPPATPAPKPADAETKTNAVERIGNFNILRVDLSVHSETLLSVAAAQSKMEESPQEQLAKLHLKAQAILQAIEKHESGAKRKGLVTSEATQRRKSQVQDFIKPLFEFAKTKGVSLTDKVALKSKTDASQVRVSAQSLARKNQPPAEPAAPPNLECYLKSGLTREQQSLVYKKLAVVMKRLGAVDDCIGDPAVFQDNPVAKVVGQELDSLRTLEVKSVRETTEKLDFVQKDFARFFSEFKKQYLLQDQRKELMGQMEEFIKEFPEEQIDEIPGDIAKTVELIEAKAPVLSRFAQVVQDIAAVDQLIKGVSRQADENQDILKTLRAQAQANIQALEGNKAIGK